MNEEFYDYNNAPAFLLDQIMQARADADAIEWLLRETVPKWSLPHRVGALLTHWYHRIFHA